MVMTGKTDYQRKLMDKPVESTKEAPCTDDPCFEAWREENRDTIIIVAIEA